MPVMLQYFLCLAGIATLSYVSFQFATEFGRKLSHRWSDVLMAFVPAASAALASNAFTNNGGYPLLGRDGTLLVVWASAAICLYLVFYGKVRDTEPNRHNRNLILITGLMLALAGLLPASMTAGQLDRWFIMMTLGLAAAVYFLPKDTSFALLMLRSKKAFHMDPPLLVVAFELAFGAFFLYLLADHLATIAFEVNAQLGIGDMSFASIVFAVVLMPVFGHMIRVGCRYSGQYAQDMLISFTARFLMAFLSLLLPIMVYHENSAVFGYSMTHAFSLALLLATWIGTGSRNDDRLHSFMLGAVLLACFNTWLLP